MIKPVFVRGMVVCSVASLFCAYQLLIQGIPSIMVPQLMEAFDLDVAGIGWLTSSFLYLYLIFQVPAGLVTDRVNLKSLLVVCSLLMGGACYWFSVSGSAWSAFLSRSLMGVIAGPGIISCLILACRWMPEKYFPTMAGVVESVTMVGGGLGPLLLPHILESTGWQHTMKTVSMVGIVLAILIICFVSNRPAAEDKVEDRKTHTNDVEDSRRESVFSRAAFIQCCLFGFGMFAIISSFGGLWGVPFLYERYPDQEEAVGDIVGMIFVGAALGAPILGWLASRLGSSARVMIVSSISATVFFALLVFCPCSFMVLGIFCFLTGFFTGGYLLAFSFVRQISSAASNCVHLAITNAAMLAAGPIMQPLIGMILETKAGEGLSVLSVEDFQHAFLLLFLCQVVAVVLSFRLKKIESTIHTTQAIS